MSFLQDILDTSVQFGINAVAFGRAFSNGLSLMAAGRPYDDPALAHQPIAYHQQAARYRLWWSYYSGEMFDKSVNPLFAGLRGPYNVSAAYKARYNLYRNIRMLYNPVNRLVEFYVGQLYPGLLSEDGEALPDGIPIAIPFSKDTTPAVKSAVAQLWQWSDWQALKSIEIRYAAALGNCLVEVVDDVDNVEGGRVTFEIVHPADVAYLELDASGKVQKYLLQYEAYDRLGVYTYQKWVDRDSIQYFRNGESYDYGQGSYLDNPYGFIPAVWFRHVRTGSVFGIPVIAGSLGKIDQLNSTASHLHDYFGKRIGSPIVFWSDNDVSRFFTQSKRGSTDSFTAPTSDEESVFLLQGGSGGRVDSLVADLNSADVLSAMNALMGEVENDHPELAFYRELRNMSQVTGPAAARLVGDVANRVSEAQATYDAGNIRLWQMALMIAGFRANSGAWGTLTSQQEKFTPFDLDSQMKGDIDMAIMPRPLLTPTKLEIGQENELFWRGVYYGGQVGVPADLIAQTAGWTDERVSQIKVALQQKSQQAQQAQQTDVIPQHPQ